MSDFEKLEVLKLSFDEFQKQTNQNYNGHQERCAIQCVRFARLLKTFDEYYELITDEFMEYLRWGAVLHDIGKARIDERILNKADKLSEDEWMIVKAHPRNGSRIIDSVKLSKPDVSLTVLHHQEKWDGSGYPCGLKEYDIPLYARIIKPIDVLDAMTNYRPYREVHSIQHALNEMVTEVGTSFDPKIFSAFLKFMKE